MRRLSGGAESLSNVMLMLLDASWMDGTPLCRDEGNVEDENEDVTCEVFGRNMKSEVEGTNGRSW